jgi:hypothetical protein
VVKERPQRNYSVVEMAETNIPSNQHYGDHSLGMNSLDIVKSSPFSSEVGDEKAKWI